MKTQLFGRLMIVSGMMLVCIWLVIAPALAAHAGATAPASTVALGLASAPGYQVESARLAHTADITFTPAFTTYLSLVVNAFPPPPTGIYGQITFHGTPMDGLQIKLQLCDLVGNGWICSPRATTSTQWGGRYEFTTAVSLDTNQKYVVTFDNPAYDTRFLSNWWSFSLYAYTAGQVLAGGDFDVADVELLSPPDMTNASLPVTFQWQPRAGAPSDSYMLELYRPPGLFFTPKLGYVGNHVLNSLPTGFTTGVQYYWSIRVFGPSDSRGDANRVRTITFQ